MVLLPYCGYADTADYDGKVTTYDYTNILYLTVRIRILNTITVLYMYFVRDYRYLCNNDFNKHVNTLKTGSLKISNLVI